MQMKLGREAFVELHPYPFLLKRPSPRGSREPPSPGAIPYDTGVAIMGELVDEALGADCALFPVKKREGNPFPERISIGRAPNCDVVIRLPFVSKLHAHLVVHEDGSFALADNRSSNGTEVNGRELAAGETVPLSLGDRLTLGVLNVELVDAAAVFDLLSHDGT